MAEVLVRPAQDQSWQLHPIPGRQIEIGVGDRTVRAKREFDEIDKRLLLAIPSEVQDLLQIAFFVFIADRTVSRGSRDEVSLGTSWYRKFRFTIPVYNVDLWRQPHVIECLKAALYSLSSDHFHFEFESLEWPGQPTGTLRMGEAEDFNARHVALFSGGLDSLSGAVELLAQTEDNVALVSHRSANVVFKSMKKLVRALERRFPKRVFHVPVKAHMQTDSGQQEYTQRTRSFFYAALGTAVGKTFGAERIVLFENGIVSLHLPICEQILGARATRTAHPLFLRRMNDLIGLTIDRKLSIENPFLWLTKREVVKRLQGVGGDDLVQGSISCSTVRGKGGKSHCGCCSQCIDRRFAELDAGIDLEDIYTVDLLRGGRLAGYDRTMAEAYVRTFQEMAQLDETTFFTRFTGPITEIVTAFPVDEREAVARRIYDLHRRQAETVLKVLGQGIRLFSDELAAGKLPSSSVLVLASANGVLADAEVSTSVEQKKWLDEASTDSGREISTDLAPTEPNEIILIIKGERITIQDCSDLSKRSSKLIFTLKDTHDRSVRLELPLEEYDYCETSKIATDQNVIKPTIIQQMHHLKKEVGEAARALGMSWSDYEIVQNRHGQGYRINPRARFVRLK